MSVLPAALCLLTCCAAGAQLAPPCNVTMVALNTNYRLRWDYDSSEGNSHNVSFTTQYLSKYKLKMKKHPIWTTVCTETSRWSCDLTALNLPYLGIFVVRVRADGDGIHSDWVQKEFCPDKDAAVGPPTAVDLVPVGAELEVSISDPLTSANRSMKEHLRGLYFHIHYWERSQEALASVLRSNTNLATLPNLMPWTWYCVSVQSRCDYYLKRSSFTTPRCVQTEGPVPWWQIVLYFLTSVLTSFLLIMFLLYGSFWTYKTVKATLYPTNGLPEHFRQYLHDSPSSDVPPLLTTDSESVTICSVEICPEQEEEEPQFPADPLSDNSAGCRDSEDSGVFSTSGSSLQQPSNVQSLLPPDCFQQLKMQQIKNQPSATDGVVDVWI